MFLPCLSVPFEGISKTVASLLDLKFRCVVVCMPMNLQVLCFSILHDCTLYI